MGIHLLLQAGAIGGWHQGIPTHHREQSNKHQ